MAFNTKLAFVPPKSFGSYFKLFLISKGYRTLRFWNNEIARNLPNVLETILAALTSSPLEGEETKALATCRLGDVGEGLATSNDKPIGADHG